MAKKLQKASGAGPEEKGTADESNRRAGGLFSVTRNAHFTEALRKAPRFLKAETNVLAVFGSRRRDYALRFFERKFSVARRI
ncbi:hypothetical protein [Alistipes finegoldii]|uniref:hypothetical protein n=1 Tax=Alistipes finegoldii TaxID=214856 RepID=UPI003AB1492E